MGLTKPALVAAACIFCQTAAAQQTIDIPIEEARVIATRALFAGDVELALQIANGLLRANPDDRTALLVLAAAAPRAGDPETGRKAGARAYALSQTDPQRYEAARLTALAAANQQRYTLATFWLRRALNVVPNEEERARTLRDARGLRNLNPWSTNLSFSIVPSNNVNGGAEDAEITAAGQVLTGTLSADALALSGLRATFAVQTQYRLFGTATDRLSLAASYQGARVKLEDEVVDDPTNPGAQVTLDADAFSFDAVEASVIYDRVLADSAVQLRWSAGSVDFGGDPYYDFTRFAISQRVPLSDSVDLQLSGRREWQYYESIGIRNVEATTFVAGLSYQWDNGNRLGGSLTLSQRDSESPNFNYDEWAFQSSFSFGQQLGPVTLGLNAGIRKADYPVYVLIGPVDGGRQDTTFFYGANVGFPDIEYAGFSPGLSISGSTAESNVSRFTRDSFSVGLTLNSAF
ncbi:surface lipoprotein assembly modifier [Yoonia sp. SS1-5]|uniref:Surface lipoprotein assembly modifier n=1 Tax=Yoonia rhodophyticola TaxID=3137370 RepID=A0AAN0M998_9RHOB